MARFFWIGVAGACGTWTRYLVGIWASRVLGASLPYGTFAVNLAGCFLIAGVMQVALSTTLISPTARLVLTTGFMGGLTTYSSFNYETTKLLRDGAWWPASANFALTTLGCFAAGMAGLAMARRWFG